MRRNESARTHSKPMQPAITVLTHAQPQCTTNTATNNAPYPRPIMTSALALKQGSVRASIVKAHANPAHPHAYVLHRDAWCVHRLERTMAVRALHCIWACMSLSGLMHPVNAWVGARVLKGDRWCMHPC